MVICWERAGLLASAEGSLVSLYDRQASVIRMCACMSTFLNIFSSEITVQIEAKFHMESPWDGGTKVCSNGHGHMTKMVVIPIYGKNLKNPSLPKPKCR